jgi:integrase
MHRVFVLAVYPGKLLAANPLPKGFVPKPADSKAKTYLYPNEEAALMACTTVPIIERLFYGFLARESPRAGETLGLDWHDLDLDRDVMNLDENKTDEPRSWALSPDVAEALRRYKKRFVPTPDRATLFEHNGVRQQLRAHDLRATFVTINLALGKSETWISDRTGHKSSQMIHRYKRAARTHAELNLGPLKPLHEAITELASEGVEHDSDTAA